MSSTFDPHFPTQEHPHEQKKTKQNRTTNFIAKSPRSSFPGKADSEPERRNNQTFTGRRARAKEKPTSTTIASGEAHRAR